MPATTPAARDAELRLPSYPWRFAHLAALWGFGVSQPVFSMLKGNPEFLVINGASRAEVVTFALVLTLGAPAVTVGVEWAVGLLSGRVSAMLHVLAVWAFGFVALLQVLTLFDPSSRVALLVPAVASYATAIVYTRWSPIRMFLSISAVLPVISLVAFVASAPLALADAKGARVEPEGATPVVLVIFDELPVTSLMRADGSVDSDRYPGFGRLARQGTWYSRATTLDQYTVRAVPALLTGIVPGRNTLPTLADHPRNLFTLLGESYSFRVREPVTRLCPVTYCPDHRSDRPLTSRVSGLLHDVGINYLHGSLPRGFHGDLAPLREGWGPLIGDSSRSTDEFLGTVSPSAPARTLYFFHTMQPHAPWLTLPSGRRYGSEAFVSGLSPDWAPGSYERWRDNEPLLVAQGLQRHLLEVAFLDRFLGRLLARLDETGIYDRALVIVTADHGISFRPGGWKRHVTPDNVADIGVVPLFVKYPGQRRGREDRRGAQTIDVLPTVADVLGIRLPWSVDGRSLTRSPVDRPIRVDGREEVVVASHAGIAAEVLRIARRNASYFGSGSRSLYRLGPRHDLLGRAVTGLPISYARDARITFVREAELESVRKSSGYVPAHVIGRLDWAAVRPRELIAIAVNGRIAAVTTPFVTGGRTLFSSLVDEAVLRDGANDLQVFAVRGVGLATRLVHLDGTGRDAEPLAAVRG